jgi:ribosome-associated protein
MFILAQMSETFPTDALTRRTATWRHLARGGHDRQDGAVPAHDPAAHESAEVSGPLPVAGRLLIPANELTWRFSRSSGPGGQGVNTTDSRIELSFDLLASSALTPELKQRAAGRLRNRLVGGVVTVVASEYRSQLRNRRAARERLAALLAQAIAPPPRQRRPTKPSKGAVARRLDEKSRRSLTKRLRRADPD